MSNMVSANELKVRGVGAIARATANCEEAIITVHNKSAYVVLPIEKYNQLRECELMAAVREAHEDLKQGRYHVESAEKHVKRMHRG
jgi:PHD/YefM family antitoxin component YafN of YafNO toxin-antitoxin module